jgi:hypothetical protein
MRRTGAQPALPRDDGLRTAVGPGRRGGHVPHHDFSVCRGEATAGDVTDVDESPAASRRPRRRSALHRGRARA